LTTDAYNFILNEVQVVQNGKNKGKEYLVAIGFYPDIPQLLDGLISKKMLRSRARTLEGFLSEHAKLVEEIRELFRTKLANAYEELRERLSGHDQGKIRVILPKCPIRTPQRSKLRLDFCENSSTVETL